MLKVFDGFDHYNAAADMQARRGFLNYNVNDTNNALTWVTGASGSGKAARFTTQFDTRAYSAIFGEANDEVYIGFNLKLSDGAELRIIDSDSGVTQCSILFVYTTRAIALYRGSPLAGGTLLYTSDGAAFPDATWFMFEAYIKIGETDGAINVRVNTTPVSGIEDVDTRNGSVSQFDVLSMVASAASGNVTIDVDDFYYLTAEADTGPYAMNDFLGTVQVETLFPNGNDSVSWTPLSGTNYQMVDETAMDSDTTYNYSATYNATDSFNFSALAATSASIYAVQVVAAARKDDAGRQKVQQFVKLGTDSEYSEVEHTLADTYQYFCDTWLANFTNDAAWTVGSVNALSAGYRNVTAPGYGQSYGSFYG